MTGLYASHHGVVGKHFFQHLPEKHPLLAEIMRKNGYHTFAYISHRLANQLYGYSRGFDRFIWRQTGRKASFNHIDGIMAAYEALLNNEMTNNFVFLHLFDTHIPFFPRSPYHYINNTKILESIQVLAHKQRFAQDVPEEIKRYYRASYKNKIREVDMFLDILLEKIASTTLSENTSVILTSDHGETMFENNCCLEDGSYNLLNERIEVPLLAHFPGVVKEGMTIDGYVEASVDIYPTILELAGIKTDTPYYAKSFLPDKKKGAVGKDFAISELIYKRGYQVTIQTKTLKYHRVCKRNPADGYISPEPSYESLVELRDHKEPRTNLLENDEGLKDSFVKIMRDLYLAEHYKESDYYKRCVSQYVY
jgi:arylsulfatase A-like enzyme